MQGSEVKTRGERERTEISRPSGRSTLAIPQLEGQCDGSILSKVITDGERARSGRTFMALVRRLNFMPRRASDH